MAEDRAHDFPENAHCFLPNGPRNDVTAFGSFCCPAVPVQIAFSSLLVGARLANATSMTLLKLSRGEMTAE
jgi:hypothetical protein